MEQADDVVDKSCSIFPFDCEVWQCCASVYIERWVSAARTAHRGPPYTAGSELAFDVSDPFLVVSRTSAGDDVEISLPTRHHILRVS